MKTRIHATGLLLPSLLCLSIGQLAAQQRLPSPNEPHIALSGEQVVAQMVQRNLERDHALASFQGTRMYRLEYHGFPGSRSAEMVVDVKYTSPAGKEFTIQSAVGSKLLIDRVLKKLLQSEMEAQTAENQSRVALNNDNYNFTLVGREDAPRGSLYILAVEPRTKDKLLYRGRIWVDATDFAVVRIEAEPAKSPSFWIKDTSIEHTYAKVADFWLPASNRSASSTRLGGHALLTIDYKDYRVTSTTPSDNSRSALANHR